MDPSKSPTDPAQDAEVEQVDPAPDPSLTVPPPPSSEVPIVADSLAAQTGRSLAIVGVLALAAAILLVALVLLTVDDETTVATPTTTTPIQSAPVVTPAPPDLAAAAVVDRIRPAQQAVNGNLRSIRLTVPRLARLRNAALYLAVAVADARAMLPTVAHAGHRDALRVALGAEETFADALLALPKQPGLVTPRHARTVRDTATRARGAWSRVAAIEGVTMLPVGPAWAKPLVERTEAAASARALDASATANSLSASHARAAERARAAAAAAAAAAAGEPAFSATGPVPAGTRTISSPTRASHCRFYARIPYSAAGESGVVCTSNAGPKAGYAALLTASGSTWLGRAGNRWSLAGGSVLPYGSATSSYGITCSSSRTALSCSGADNGITLAKESHTSW